MVRHLYLLLIRLFPSHDPIADVAKQRDKKRQEIFRKASAAILNEKEEKKKQFQSSFRDSFATGGLVEGKDDVPYTKENPADRVDPFTGQPYSAQMKELGLDVFQER